MAKGWQSGEEVDEGGYAGSARTSLGNDVRGKIMLWYAQVSCAKVPNVSFKVCVACVRQGSEVFFGLAN